jgi:hypothetical protein
MVYSGIGLRKYLLHTCTINEIINLEGYSFAGVNVETIIIIATKNTKTDNSIKVFSSLNHEFKFSHIKMQEDFKLNDGYEFKVFADDSSSLTIQKLRKNSANLDDLVDVKAGLQAYEKDKGEPKQTEGDVKARPYDFSYKYDENTHPYLDGKDVNRYWLNWSGQYLKYGKHLAAPRTFNLFEGKKIIVREIAGKYPKSIIATFSDELYLYNRSSIAIIERPEKEVSLKYVLALLNSSLMSYYFLKNTAKAVRKMFPKVILNDLRLFPIKEIGNDAQMPFIAKADIMLTSNKDLQTIQSQFLTLLQRKFELT